MKNCFFLIPVCFYANTVFADNIVELGTIDVIAKQGTNDDGKAAPFTKHAIENTATEATIANILQVTPNVGFLGGARHGGQTVKIRGLEGDRVAVSIDGVALRSQIKHNQFLDIDPILLKQIDVQKGVAPARYGSGLGGMVAITSKDAEDLLALGRQVGGYLTSGYQSAADEFNIGGAVYNRTDHFDNMLQISKRDSGNIRLGGGQKLTSSERKVNAIAKVTYLPDDMQRLQFYFQTNQLASFEPINPQKNFPPNMNPMANKDVATHISKIQYEINDPEKPWLNLNAKIYRTDQNTDTLTSANAKTMQKLSRSGAQLNNTSTIAEGKHILTYGAEVYQEAALDSQSINARANSYGGYASHQWRDKFFNLGEFSITPSARMDIYERKNTNYHHLSPQVTVTYNPITEVGIFGKYAHAFRAPSFNEAFASGNHFSKGFFQNNFIANPSLKPETINTYEFGGTLNWANVLTKEDTVNLKFSRFFTYGRDYIYLDVQRFTSQFLNMPRVRLHGYEIEACYSQRKFDIQLGFARTTGKNSITNQYINTTITPPTLTSAIAYKFSTVKIGWQGIFAANANQVNKADDRRSGYGVHNIFLTYTPPAYENVAINAGIDNIFDRTYAPAFAGSLARGVNYKLQLSIKV